MRTIRRLVTNPLGLIGLVLVLFWAIIALSAPLIAPPAERQRDPYSIRRVGFSSIPQPPSEESFLGTTGGGYDILYGIVWGSRTAFRVGLIVVSITSVIGVLLGGLGVGYVRTDYFAGGRYPKAHHEMRQFPWTLHCSLAFLGGLHVATGDDSYRALAVQDTNWFLARVAEAKDSVSSPYANEAAVWILDTIDDPSIQGRLRGELTKCFGQSMANSRRTWWTSSGGRGALLLPGLVYCARSLPRSAARQAALAQALWSLCAEASPLSIQNTIERQPTTTNGEVVMYICFSSLGLAELLEPRSTLMPK